MLRRMKISSTVPLPGLSPACSFLSLCSTAPCIRLVRIFPSTLLAIGSNVTPLHFPHCCRFPFFGILHISPCFHCSDAFALEYHSGAFSVSLQQFCCYLVGSWRLPILESLHRPVDFLLCWWLRVDVRFLLFHLLIHRWVWWCLPTQDLLKVPILPAFSPCP